MAKSFDQSKCVYDWYLTLEIFSCFLDEKWNFKGNSLDVKAIMDFLYSISKRILVVMTILNIFPKSWS